MCDDWLAKQVRTNLGNDYQYVAVYSWNNYSDFYMDELTPFEWALAFKFFNATFTHFFHGTLFSLKNHVITFAIEKRTQYALRYKTKIVDVLDRLDMANIHFFDDELNTNNWNVIKQTVENGINEEYISKIENGISKEVKSSDSFFEAIRNFI